MRYALALLLLLPVTLLAQAPAATGATDKLPFIKVDVPAKRVMIECQAVNAEMPLEFLCVLAGTAEHETILRTQAKPSNIHLALLMVGLKPGEPIRYSPATEKWLPPQGPPVQISVEYKRNDQVVSMPAWKLFRQLKTKEAMPPRTWIFVGSKVYKTGQYAADITGYVVSIVNFDLSLIDVPWLVSSSNETLEYELNPETAPPTGAPVTLIIEPAGAALTAAPASQPSAYVTADQVKIDQLRDEWKREVASQAKAVQGAATGHYRIINELRAEQNRLIDEAERVGRVIDQLEKQYQDITVPRPATQERF